MEPAVAPAPPAWRVNPYLAIFVCEALVTASEVLLKLGARDSAAVAAPVSWLAWIGVTGLTSLWTWLAIPFLLASFAAWLWIIRLIPLNIASLLSNVVHIMIPLSCLLFLGEQISAQRWAGIALVLTGLCLVVPPAEVKAPPSAS